MTNLLVGGKDQPEQFTQLIVADWTAGCGDLEQLTKMLDATDLPEYGRLPIIEPAGNSQKTGQTFTRLDLAAILGLRGYHHAADRCLEQLLQENPDNVYIRGQYADLRMLQRRPVRAESVLREGLRRNPGRSSVSRSV